LVRESSLRSFCISTQVKVVTLRGHSISKSGAMTGGSSAAERVDRWEEREVDGLRQRKAELEGKVWGLLFPCDARVLRWFCDVPKSLALVVCDKPQNLTRSAFVCQSVYTAANVVSFCLL
jgi:hypothetical protein